MRMQITYLSVVIILIKTLSSTSILLILQITLLKLTPKLFKLLFRSVYLAVVSYLDSLSKRVKSTLVILLLFQSLKLVCTKLNLNTSVMILILEITNINLSSMSEILMLKLLLLSLLTVKINYLSILKLLLMDNNFTLDSILEIDLETLFLLILLIKKQLGLE